jgi:hypothetical protein
MEGGTEEAYQYPVRSGDIVVGGSRDRTAENLFRQAIKDLASSLISSTPALAFRTILAFEILRRVYSH